jgi:hypothetical protein
MSQVRNLSELALNVNSAGNTTSISTTSGFSISESGGKLVFKYGSNTIATMDSSGNFVATANVVATGNLVSYNDVIGFGP